MMPTWQTINTTEVRSPRSGAYRAIRLQRLGALELYRTQIFNDHGSPLASLHEWTLDSEAMAEAKEWINT